MKNFLKVTASLLLILALSLSPILSVSARATGGAGKYDPYSEGIVSSYYRIDREKGFITGIAPGTSAQRLINACLPAGVTVSQEKLATGATVTVTCAAPLPPETEPEQTEPETTEPPTEAPSVPEDTTVVTDPSGDTTESSVPSSDDTSVPVDATDETVPPEEETEPETTEVSEGSTEPTPQTCAAAEPETKTYSLTVIVTGDLNGDGNVTITDMLMLKSAILGGDLSATAAAAADINYDSKITITDFLKVKSCLLGLETISAGWPAGTAPADPLILTTPGGHESWSVSGAVAYISDNDTVASIDESGSITAGSGEGSTFVYALDDAGNALSRAIVTVLNEKLTVSLSADSHKLIIGQSVTLTPRFNHLTTAPITWTSSDPAVATVDGNGNVKTVGLGTATVTATLPNGSSATVSVSVAPPIKTIVFGKSLYKVKPGSSRVLDVTVTPGDTGEELIWASSNPAIATVSSDGTVTGVSKGTVTITVKGKYSGLSASCSVKICNVKQVAITFDDGPSVHTAELLNYLKESGIKATFFMVGNRLQSYSNTVKQMVADGHEIGYHSYAHALQSYIPLSQVASDYEASSKILKELTGAEFTVWRAPGGDYNTAILNRIPLPHISWSVDTRDWATQSVDSNYYSIRQAEDGDIILLHDLYSPSVKGAIKAMKEMLAGDYEFLTVTELLSRSGEAPKNHTNYFNG